MHYNSSTTDVDGKKDSKEVFELKRPDFHLEAKKVPGKNIFDVTLKQHDPQGNWQTEEKQCSLKQL